MLGAQLAGSSLTAGVHHITVFTPAPGGGETDAKEFTVGNPAPVIDSVAPASALATVSTTFTISGRGFVSTSVVTVDDQTVTPDSIASTAIVFTTTFPTAGARMVTVSNSTPGGGTSNAATIDVGSPPVPQVGSVVFISSRGQSAQVGSAQTVTIEVRSTAGV